MSTETGGCWRRSRTSRAVKVERNNPTSEETLEWQCTGVAVRRGGEIPDESVPERRSSGVANLGATGPRQDSEQARRIFGTAQLENDEM